MYIEKGSKPKIAEENIVVYKDTCWKSISGNVFISRYEGFTYTINKINYSDIEIESEQYITLGFHSYKEIEAVDTFLSSCIGEFIIPKGATYYEGKDQDAAGEDCYVSNQIIFKRIIS